MDSFETLDHLDVGATRFAFRSLVRAEANGLDGIGRLPACMKVLLLNLLHHEDGEVVTGADLEAFASWSRHGRAERDLAFHPGRILTHDVSGLPLLADLAAMRDAVADAGGDIAAVNPQIPVHLVVDHSVTVDEYAHPGAAEGNVTREYRRNAERYAFLRWSQQAFTNLTVFPPGTGICHQVNLEHIASVVTVQDSGATPVLLPDTLLGMDSHTPMINALGVLGWGVGGIEAASAMLRQPVSLPMPEVVGVRLAGRLRAGVTATDLVLTLTQRLREHGVVQRFVEFTGPGLDTLSLPDRATCANMAPEYGATVGFFPLDRIAMDYLRLTGRDPEHVARVEAYARAQGMWREADSPAPRFTDTIEFDLDAVEPSLAGPRRPQDRVPLGKVCDAAATAMPPPVSATGSVPASTAPIEAGAVAVAAISSCTNTSNPGSMLAAGLLARRAVARGLRTAPWVKTSLSPGSRVVADYLEHAGLQDALDTLGFNVTGFGCMTCMGNSGPLAGDIDAHVREHGTAVAAVVSSNRNFEGRLHRRCALSFIASPPLVVAYALAGSVLRDLTREPIGHDPQGRPVHLAEIWPDAEEVRALEKAHVRVEDYRQRYAAGEDRSRWTSLGGAGGERFAWDATSSYILRPPFFGNLSPQPAPAAPVENARALLLLGDSVTTDHISPVGAFDADTAAGQFLEAGGVAPADFNSFGARRVNHHVMLRGTFANPRLHNALAPQRPGGWTRHLPGGDELPVHEAAARYARDGVPLVVIAGEDYGAGSSRDWAAKGTRLLGVRAVLARSFERIHRSNLVGMGVLPLEFLPGEDAGSHGLDGHERLCIDGLDDTLAPRAMLRCRVTHDDGRTAVFRLRCRLDTARELEYWRHGGVLPFVLRQLRHG